MGLFDWLVSDEDGARCATKQVSNPMEVVLAGGNHGETLTVCSGCNRRGRKCNCDPELGRPRRWHE